MEWSTVLLSVIGVIAVVVPVAFVWSVCGGGIYKAIKGRRVTESQFSCSVDADCPPGYVCMNGRCVLQEA